jgi:hypothetical protein
MALLAPAISGEVRALPALLSLGNLDRPCLSSDLAPVRSRVHRKDRGVVVVQLLYAN